METIFVNTQNHKTHEPQKFVLSLLQRLDLRVTNKHAALKNLSIYYMWKNIRQQYKNNKLKITVECGVMSLNCMMVLIQCQIFKIISSTSEKSMTINPLILTFIFTSAGLIIDSC